MRFSGSTPSSRQSGVAALLFLFVLIFGVAGWLVSGLSSARFEIERDTQTAAALAKAKEALISYAANDPGATRPGELPCPDVNNDGVIIVSQDYSGSNCTNLLGRLPYRTLGLPDLRDADGERLWYALSNNFRANGTNAINSDTTGQLVVTGSSPASNVVAIVFSPGPALSAQVRNTANVNDATHFLEGENANGPPNYVAGMTSATFNDRALTIVADELFSIVEKRVIKEVERALSHYYNFDPMQRVFPPPARFNDSDCFTPPITTGCQSDPSVDQGRIPANPTPRAWTPSAGIANLDETDWFQANGWREMIYYAPAYACTNPGGPDCTWCSLYPLDPRCSVATGAGFATLNVPPGTPLANQKVVVIAAGRARPPAQVRGNNLEKTTLSNYVELENANEDNTYVRDVVSVNLNDRVLSIP